VSEDVPAVEAALPAVEAAAPTPGPPRVWPVFVGFVVVFVTVQVAGTVVLAAWAFLMTRPGAGPNGFVAALESLSLSPAGLSVAAGLSSGGLLAGALMAARLSPSPWRERLRLTMRGVTPGRVALAVVGVLAVSQSLDALVGLLGLSGFGALDYINRVVGRASAGWLAVMAVMLALGPGIAEELFFRGFMQTRLVQRWGAVAGVAIASACFGFIHFDLVHTPVAAVLGVYLGWVAERTGTIVPAMAAHFVNNLVAVLTARVVLPSGTSARLAFLAGGIVVTAAVVAALRHLPASYDPASASS
jgi:membrane protease YdiL (CAAX protease family)